MSTSRWINRVLALAVATPVAFVGLGSTATNVQASPVLQLVSSPTTATAAGKVMGSECTTDGGKRKRKALRFPTRGRTTVTPLPGTNVGNITRVEFISKSLLMQYTSMSITRDDATSFKVKLKLVRDYRDKKGYNHYVAKVRTGQPRPNYAYSFRLHSRVTAANDCWQDRQVPFPRTPFVPSLTVVNRNSVTGAVPALSHAEYPVFDDCKTKGGKKGNYRIKTYTTVGFTHILAGDANAAYFLFRGKAEFKKYTTAEVNWTNKSHDATKVRLKLTQISVADDGEFMYVAEPVAGQRKLIDFVSIRLKVRIKGFEDNTCETRWMKPSKDDVALAA